MDNIISIGGSMTLLEMVNQGSILNIIGMIIIFILMILMISKIGNGVFLKFDAEKKNQPVVSSVVKAGDGVTAAIIAAIHEYRKQ